MSTFTFFPAIPQPSDNPSVSQGQLLQNFTSLGASNSWTTQDHFGFGTGTDGWHKQITLPDNGTLGSFSGLQSGIVTVPGVASSSASQLVFKNSAATVPLSLIRAYGWINPNSISLTQSYNIASFTKIGAGDYQVTLTSGCTSSSSYAIIATASFKSVGSNGVVVNYTISSQTSFFINCTDPVINSAVDPVTLGFIILQL